MSLKTIYNALVVYDGDFHIGYGSSKLAALESCYESMVESEIIDEDDWQYGGHSSKSEYLEDYDSDRQVYEWTTFMSQSIFDALEEWKGFKDG